jgi:hypothetical protein
MGLVPIHRRYFHDQEDLSSETHGSAPGFVPFCPSGCEDMSAAASHMLDEQARGAADEAASDLVCHAHCRYFHDRGNLFAHAVNRLTR